MFTFVKRDPVYILQRYGIVMSATLLVSRKTSRAEKENVPHIVEESLIAFLTS